MKQIQFDSNGIYASNPKLSAIALQVMEQEKRERELRRSLTDEDLNGDGVNEVVSAGNRNVTAVDPYVGSYCNDSDPEDNPLIKGMVEALYPDGQFYTDSDKCGYGNTYTWERYCSSIGTIVSKSVLCPVGTTCSDGEHNTLNCPG